MLADGDRIVVGVSGGADSLTLMLMLQERLARIPIHYELNAVYLDPGFEGSFAEPLKKNLRENQLCAEGVLHRNAMK